MNFRGLLLNNSSIEIRCMDALAKLEEDFNTDVQRIHLSKITPILSVSSTAIANSYRFKWRF